MQIDPDQASALELYTWMVGLITPRPIAWVSTQAADGRDNLAPYSFFNGVGSKPPTVVFCPANGRNGRPKDTLANIRDNGQFVVNLVTEPLAGSMNQTSAEYDPGVDEFEQVGLEKRPSVRVRPPRVAEAAGAFECELLQAIQLGTGPGGANLVIGRIVWIHVDDRCVDDQGRLRGHSPATIGRIGGPAYVRTDDRFEMPRPPRPDTRDQPPSPRPTG